MQNKKNRGVLSFRFLSKALTASKSASGGRPAAVSGKSGGAEKTQLLVPQSGRNRKLVELANRNAESLLERTAGGPAAIEELKRVLGLPELPRTIEGFDISNTSGLESVGSMVVFRDGRPDKDEYRHFNIRSVEGPNDVASLEEVIRRRYGRVVDEAKPLPDLVMVDGGKGQLAAAEKALAGVGASGVPLVSIAKKEEILFTPDKRDGIRLERTSPALKLIQALRDEAHRFAITAHRNRREKRSFESELDGIPGLGPKKKAALLARFGGIDEIRSAKSEDLAKVVGDKPAAALLEKLRRP